MFWMWIEISHKYAQFVTSVMNLCNESKVNKILEMVSSSGACLAHLGCFFWSSSFSVHSHLDGGLEKSSFIVKKPNSQFLDTLYRDT